MESNTDLELGEVDIVSETVQLLLDCEVKGHVRVHSCIFKVPSVLRDISPSSYNPKVVSLGPLHREAKNVQAMEARKATYLHDLLDRLELPHRQTLKACVEKVTDSVNKIKKSYDEMKSYTDVELAKMMVMDGFFILEFFHNFDKHYSDALLAFSILYDLLLIENQIPFFVLQDLFECTILKCQPNVSLIKLILEVLEVVNHFPGNLKEDNVLRGSTPDHILGVLHKCYRPEESIQHKFSNKKIHSATELDRAGVKFKPTQDPSWPMAIEVESSKFGCFSWSWGKPTLRMPVMGFQDDTESLIRNLIVYEQCSSHVPNYITSYAVAIDSLVDSKEDIVMLMDAGVIINDLGSNEEAANIINSISKEINGDDFFYYQQWVKIDEYYNGYWPKNLARLRRTYFSNPWSIIALLAGIILFTLTIVQTIFTINPV